LQHTEYAAGEMKKLITYFLLAYFISWIIWLPLVLEKYGITGLPILPEYHHNLGSFGPMIAAIISKYIFEGRNGVKDIFRRMISWRVNWIWYLVVLVLPVLLVIITRFIDQSVNNNPFSMKGFSVNDEFPQFGPLAYFLFNLCTFGIGEETGWRGYALPALQKKFSALTSTLILTVFWACWHIPAFFYRLAYGHMDVSAIVGFFFSLLMGSFVLTWLYNSTRGSLLIVALFHAMIELMFISENITPEMTKYEGIILMIAAVLILIIAKPKNLSFIERQSVNHVDGYEA
jgi:membrane protease YdiL (CAAX protease family)